MGGFDRHRFPPSNDLGVKSHVTFFFSPFRRPGSTEASVERTSPGFFCYLFFFFFCFFFPLLCGFYWCHGSVMGSTGLLWRRVVIIGWSSEPDAISQRFAAVHRTPQPYLLFSFFFLFFFLFFFFLLLLLLLLLLLFRFYKFSSFFSSCER